MRPHERQECTAGNAHKDKSQRKQKCFVHGFPPSSIGSLCPDSDSTIARFWGISNEVAAAPESAAVGWLTFLKVASRISSRLRIETVEYR